MIVTCQGLIATLMTGNVIVFAETGGKFTGGGDYESRRYETDNSGSTGKTYGSFDGLDSSSSSTNNKKDKIELSPFSSYISGSQSFEDSGKKGQLFEPVGDGEFGGNGWKLSGKVSAEYSSGEGFSFGLGNGRGFKPSASSGKFVDSGSGGFNGQKSSSGSGFSDSQEGSSGAVHKLVGSAGDYGDLNYGAGDYESKSSGSYGSKSSGVDGNGAKGFDSGATSFENEDVASGFKGVGASGIDFGAKIQGSVGNGGKGYGSGGGGVGGSSLGLKGFVDSDSIYTSDLISGESESGNSRSKGLGDINSGAGYKSSDNKNNGNKGYGSLDSGKGNRGFGRQDSSYGNSGSDSSGGYGHKQLEGSGSIDRFPDTISSGAGGSVAKSDSGYSNDKISALDNIYDGKKNNEFYSGQKQPGFIGFDEEDSDSFKSSPNNGESSFSSQDFGEVDNKFKGPAVKNNKDISSKGFDGLGADGKDGSGESSRGGKFTGGFSGGKTGYSSENSDFGGGKTGYISENSDFGGGKTGYSTENSDFGGRKTGYISENSDFGGEKTGYSSENSDFGGRKTISSGGKKDYGGGKIDDASAADEYSDDKSLYSGGKNDYVKGKTDQGSVKNDYGSGKADYGGGKFDFDGGKTDYAGGGVSDYGSSKTDLYSSKVLGGGKGGLGGKFLYGSSKQSGGSSDSSGKEYDEVYSQGGQGKQMTSDDVDESSGKKFQTGSEEFESNGLDSKGVSDNGGDYDAVEQIDDNTVCQSGVEFAPHPLYCNKFFQCANKKPFMIICPKGLLYNSKYHICDWPSNVDCTFDSDISVMVSRQLHLPSSRHPRDMLTQVKTKKLQSSKPVQSPAPSPKASSKPEPLKLQPITEYSSAESSNIYSDSKDGEKKSGDDENEASYYTFGDDDRDYVDSKGDDWEKPSYNAPAQGSGGVTCSYGVKFIRHPNDCTKFYQCAHSKPFLMSCPAGLYFNTDIDVCDWPSNVDCSGSGQTRQSTDYDSGYSDNSWSSQSSAHHKDKSAYIPTVYSAPPYSSSDSKSQEPSYYQSPQPHSFDSSSSSGGSGYPMAPGGGQSMPGFFPMSPFHYPIMPVFHPPIFQPIVPYFPKQNPPTYQTSSSKANEKGDSGGDDNKSKEEEVDDDGAEEEDSKKGSQDSYDSKGGQESDDSSRSYDHKQSTDESWFDYSYQQGSQKSEGQDSSSTKFVRRPQKISNKNGNGNGKQGDYGYYYDYDTFFSGSGGNGGSNMYDYFTYDYGGKVQDYGSSSFQSSGNKRKQFKSGALNQPQYFGSAFKELSKYKNLQQSLKKINDANDDVEYIHFDHTGSGSSKGSQGHGHMHDSGLSSLLPLILLGSSQGQQLILTSAILSKLKGVSSSMGGKGLLGGSKGGSSDLIKTLFLLRLLSNSQTTTTTTTTTATPLTVTPNIQFVGPGFVTIATGAPVVFIDPITGQQVADANVAIDPISGAVFDVTTNRVLMYQDPTTGQLTQAFAAAVTTVPLATARSLNPATNVIRRALQRNPLTNLLNVGNSNNRIVSVVQPPTVSPAGTVTGRDAINLIFLSPLTPSSLPPPVVGHDGGATMIRGSLRDILGDDLTRFINNAQLVPGQGLPNSPAGSHKPCAVVRSGETVPFRVSPRAGRRLTSEECQAMGQLLDKFIPTFLQNFVPSDAAFAGFGANQRNNNNNNNNNSRNTPLQPASSGNTLEGSRVTDIFGGALNPISPTPGRPDATPTAANSLNQYINIRNDREGCTIAVPNIIPQC
ncbi:hypothetical protein Btru_030483 [Bulinus truncatus]|nr:hypothetical protein Btru_030483 [Bulinus truncatus]